MNKDAYSDINDKELLQKFYEQGDSAWLGLLLERYTLLLLGVCMKYLKDENDAKDAVQQVFLKAIIELKKYKVEYFKSWVYMVAKNQCLMTLRNRHARQPQELEDEVQSALQSTSLNEVVEKDKTLTLVEESVHELSPEQQLCVTLFYLQKKSYNDITSATGFSLLQVKSYLQNGKRNLKLIVEKKLRQTNG